MSYSKTEKTFNLTSTKLRKWHMVSGHKNQPGCIFCEGDMYKIEKYFRDNDLFGIVSVGHAWIKIKAEKNYRSVMGGITDETEKLYKMITEK